MLDAQWQCAVKMIGPSPLESNGITDDTCRPPDHRDAAKPPRQLERCGKATKKDAAVATRKERGGVVDAPIARQLAIVISAPTRHPVHAKLNVTFVEVDRLLCREHLRGGCKWPKCRLIHATRREADAMIRNWLTAAEADHRRRQEEISTYVTTTATEPSYRSTSSVFTTFCTAFRDGGEAACAGTRRWNDGTNQAHDTHDKSHRHHPHAQAISGTHHSSSPPGGYHPMPPCKFYHGSREDCGLMMRSLAAAWHDGLLSEQQLWTFCCRDFVFSECPRGSRCRLAHFHPTAGRTEPQPSPLWMAASAHILPTPTTSATQPGPRTLVATMTPDAPLSARNFMGDAAATCQPRPPLDVRPPSPSSVAASPSVAHRAPPGHAPSPLPHDEPVLPTGGGLPPQAASLGWQPLSSVSLSTSLS